MLLAFSRDLRVVLLRLASRLQTLRWYAAAKTRLPAPRWRWNRSRCSRRWPTGWASGRSSGNWRTWPSASWTPASYRHIAPCWTRSAPSASRRGSRRVRLASLLAEAGLKADVQGRPKHLYSIWKKMQGKGLDIAQVFDVRALRVIVDDVAACYAALARCTRPSARWTASSTTTSPAQAQRLPVLHTVVLADDGRPLEVQIRTRPCTNTPNTAWPRTGCTRKPAPGAMPASAPAATTKQRLAEARKAVLRELLAWERDFASGDSARGRRRLRRPHLRLHAAGHHHRPARRRHAGGLCLHLHTDLGHRCRGARVDGAMVPLNTPLQHGQTVEIVAAKDGGPSMDWLNPELGYLQSPRARAKVRAWFNAQAVDATIARGRELVEKLLQREGRTALKLEHLAEQLGFKSADACSRWWARTSSRCATSRTCCAGATACGRCRRGAADQALAQPPGRGGVLVVGVGSLMTALARCCRPAPPDAIGGFVTRGKGVAVHRRDCSNFRHMAQRFRGARSRCSGARAGPPRQAGRLPAGREHRGRRPPGPAARHLRSLRQGAAQRDRGQHAVAARPGGRWPAWSSRSKPRTPAGCPRPCARCRACRACATPGGAEFSVAPGNSPPAQG
jgi:GTP pyrophosphokinase